MSKSKHKTEKEASYDLEQREEKDKQGPLRPEDTTASPESTATGRQPESETEELKQKLVESANRIKELEDRLLRLAAEFDNYKKRTIKEFDNIIKNANENLILNQLDILNNFFRALESSRDKKDYQGLRAGVELIYNQMQNLLTREGLQEIKAKGEEFDPALHEAVMQVESDQKEGTILEEVAKGYKLNDKVLRHSQVVVAKNKSNSGQDSQAENDVSQEGKGE